MGLQSNHRTAGWKTLASGAIACLCASTALFAQSGQKRAPQSLPAIMSANAIHSTAPISITPAEPPLHAFLFAPLEKQINTDPIDGRDLKNAPNACKKDSVVVCYDYRRRHSVIPMTKNWMPDMPGMKKEGVTLKRDKIALTYSF